MLLTHLATNHTHLFLVVLENMSSRPTIAELIGKDKELMPWLISRAQRKETAVSQNKQYAAEVLAILLQSSAINRKRFVDLDGIDTFLQLLSAYRKRDPAKGTEEEEYVENVFDCVTCCVDEQEGKQKFLDAEGVELCLIMLKEGKMSRPRALRLLDHALAGSDGAACCEKLVDAAGLKVVFTMFMKKASALRTIPTQSPQLTPNSTTFNPPNTSSAFSPPCSALCPATPHPGSASLRNLLKRTMRKSIG